MQKGSHNPWIGIADLLSGFVVVMLLLFVSAALLPHFAHKVQAKADAAQRDAATQEAERRAAVLQQLDERLEPFVKAGVVVVDRANQRIELRDVSFESSSACLTPEAETAVDAMLAVVPEQLRSDPRLHIHVEGHTDPRPVKSLTRSCGWFADNVQLSALRATNVRNRLLGEGSEALRTRVPVTGWGADHLRNSTDVSAPENRRIELHLEWRDDGPVARGANDSAGVGKSSPLGQP